MRSRANKKTILAELQKVSALSKGLQKTPRSAVNNVSAAALCFGAACALAWILGEEETPSERIVRQLSQRTGRSV